MLEFSNEKTQIKNEKTKREEEVRFQLETGENCYGSEHQSYSRGVALPELCIQEMLYSPRSRTTVGGFLTWKNPPQFCHLPIKTLCRRLTDRSQSKMGQECGAQKKFKLPSIFLDLLKHCDKNWLAELLGSVVAVSQSQACRFC